MKWIDDTIENLVPYSSARSEQQKREGVWLDANESPFQLTGYESYPDTYQTELKQKMSSQLNIPLEKMVLGNGSDDLIDLVLKAFGVPGKGSCVVCPPTYGMYRTVAEILRIKVVDVPLLEGFQWNTINLLKQSNDNQVLFICSPNNPTGNEIDQVELRKIIAGFDGIVVVDEAYIDFSERDSIINWINEYSNLIVLQTLSKSFGLAGIRLGILISNPGIIRYINKVRTPYNIGQPSIDLAIEWLEKEKSIERLIDIVKQQKLWLINQLESLEVVQKVYPSSANFLLVQFQNAERVYEYLAQSGVFVRNRSDELQCENCLRITIGTPQINQLLIDLLQVYESEKSAISR